MAAVDKRHVFSEITLKTAFSDYYCGLPLLGG